MTTVQTQRLIFDKQRYLQQVSQLWAPTLRHFNRRIEGYVFFNFIFCLLGIIEFALFFFLFALFNLSTLLGFTLAIFFLTLFSYFLLRIYLQAKKPDLIIQLCEEYLDRCKGIINYQEGIPEHHIALAGAAQKFAASLHGKEYTYYSPPSFLKSLSSTMEKFSCFCHWEDIHKMREQLLHRAIDEHLKVVKCEPTHLEVHAALANAYVMLSSLYTDLRKSETHDEERWLPPNRYSPQMQSQFRATAQRAIEEFKILSDYAPDDPWVHLQLAYSFRDLKMPEEEIREYEIVLKLRPDDKETLFKLGMLYFRQGKNANGLRVYELLKRTNYDKAESLIKFYGTYDVS